jgi:hypothetical protein
MAKLRIGRDHSSHTQDFELVDLHEAAQVEVIIDAEHKLWINLNGKCLLRVGKCADIIIQDDRSRGRHDRN